jgi:hypothetical protein
LNRPGRQAGMGEASIPAFRPGLFTTGPSDLKSPCFKNYAALAIPAAEQSEQRTHFS